MKIDILTLFPDVYTLFLETSIIGRALASKKAVVGVHNIREYAKNKQRQVDDAPYGGGHGMVLMCQPIFDAVEALKQEQTKVVLLTPQGVLYNQKLASTLSKESHLILISGNYEGFDERISALADFEISIGDYVLTGGDLPSMVVTDSIIRLVPGVINKEAHQVESFKNAFLDYSNYTKPREYKGLKVPDVLLSGHHQQIDKWRQTERIIKTMKKRPDLLKQITYAMKREGPGLELTYFNYEPALGYELIPKNDAKRQDVITIRRMVLFKRAFIEKVVKLKVERKLKRFVKSIYEVAVNDEDPDEVKQMMDEIKAYQEFIKDNYLLYLSLNDGDLMMKKLQLLLNELRLKQYLKVSPQPVTKDERVK